MGESKLHVAIVGAGLGGLAAAIGIARAGHNVTILEQAAVLGEVHQRSPKRYLLLTLLCRWAQAYRFLPTRHGF